MMHQLFLFSVVLNSYDGCIKNTGTQNVLPGIFELFTLKRSRITGYTVSCEQ